MGQGSRFRYLEQYDISFCTGYPVVVMFAIINVGIFSSIGCVWLKMVGRKYKPSTLCFAANARIHRFRSWTLAIMLKASADTRSCHCIKTMRSERWTYSGATGSLIVNYQMICKIHLPRHVYLAYEYTP